MNIYYFDNAATTKLDEEVLKEMLPYLIQNYGNASSPYKLGRHSRKAVEISREKVANALNANKNEIYFTSGGSESDNTALFGIASAYSSKGKHIITSQIEHPAILETCKQLEKEGYEITYLPVDDNGAVSIEELKKAIKPSTILISIMFANNEIGTIQPIEQIGEIARKHNIYFHTDAVQAIGNVNIDVKKYKIDALSMSAHKFYGPKGMGVAYINEKVPFIRIQDGGHQEKNKRAGTENVPGIVGIGKALELANRNLIEYNVHLKTLRNYYFSEIQRRVPYIRINGDIEKRLSGNANISFNGVDGSKLLNELDNVGICASSGSACSAGFLNPSHVLLSIGVPKYIAKSSLRITFGKDNSIEDTKYLVDNIEGIVKKLRK